MFINVICQFQLTVCSYHVTYAFQSESTFYSCLNVKKLLARNRREIWSLSDCNWTRSHNHLVRKWTLNHLAKLARFSQTVSLQSFNFNSLSFWILREKSLWRTAVPVDPSSISVFLYKSWINIMKIKLNYKIEHFSNYISFFH